MSEVTRPARLAELGGFLPGISRGEVAPTFPDLLSGGPDAAVILRER